MNTRFDIKSLLASNTHVDLDDSMKTKVALRRLGYYRVPSYGMTPYPDEPLFQALSDLQTDKGIARTGEMRPGDDTEKAIRLALNDNPAASGGADKHEGKYIWRTRGDSKVRSEHAEREGKTFSWDDPPEGGHPGEAPNCRCWAEDIDTKNQKCIDMARDVENARLEVEQKRNELEDAKAKQLAWEKIFEERRQAFHDTLESFGISGTPDTKNALLRLLGRLLLAAQVIEAYLEIEAAWDSMDEADNERHALSDEVRAIEGFVEQAKQAYFALLKKYQEECPKGGN